MVVERVTVRVRLLVIAICVALLSGCVRKRTTKVKQPRGSCDGACAHYMKCKGTSDDQIYRACVAECVETFSEDGVQDTETLGHIELLNCEETVGFVEGQSGRPPGSRAPTPN